MSDRAIKDESKELVKQLNLSEEDQGVINRMYDSVPENKKLMAQTLIRDGLKMQVQDKNRNMYGFGLFFIIVLLVVAAFYFGKSRSSSK
jgi:hypothetical protein